MTLQKKRYVVLLLSIPILMLLPLVAMQFTSEVNWSLMDFVVMGVLLFSMVSVIEFLLRNVKSKKRILTLSLFTLIAFLLIWAELAVGIIGTPFAGS